MIKKVVVLDVMAGIAFYLKLVVCSFELQKMGAVIYILLDAVLVAIIAFLMNMIVHVAIRGTWKSCIINAIILVIIYIMISGVYGRTEMGMHTEKTLDSIIATEQNIDNEEESVEVSFSDGNIFSQILNYGFYFIIALAGGQSGVRIKGIKYMDSKK